MDQTNYERQFAVALGNQLVLPAGEKKFCWAIDLTGAFNVEKLIVIQHPGDAAQVGFSCMLYNRQVCDIAEGSHSSSYPASGVTPAIAEVIPWQTAAAGAASRLFEPEGYNFRNMEGSLTLPVRKIYFELVLESVQAVDTNWEVALGGSPQI